MAEQDKEIMSVPPDGRSDSEQPRWRRDFPIDWPQDHYIARRDFTKFIALTSLAFTVGQFWIGLQNIFRKQRGEPQIKRIARADEIPVGGSVTFNYPEENDKCILTRIDEKNFVAYSQECTHLSCSVTPDVEKGCFHCPCHEGYFDMKDGRPTAGPPRRSLPRISLQFIENEIFAAGVEKRLI